jgi:hypothetical protein
MQEYIVCHLEKLDEPIRLDKYNELFKEEKKDTTKKAVNADSLKTVTIDMDLILDRMEQISPSIGHSSCKLFTKKEIRQLFYIPAIMAKAEMLFGKP